MKNSSAKVLQKLKSDAYMDNEKLAHEVDNKITAAHP